MMELAYALYNVSHMELPEVQQLLGSHVNVLLERSKAFYFNEYDSRQTLYEMNVFKRGPYFANLTDRL